MLVPCQSHTLQLSKTVNINIHMRTPINDKQTKSTCNVCDASLKSNAVCAIKPSTHTKPR